MVQDSDKGQVLQLELRDHHRRPLALVVQRSDEPRLFEQLLAEASRRFDRCMRGEG